MPDVGSSNSQPETGDIMEALQQSLAAPGSMIGNGPTPDRRLMDQAAMIAAGIKIAAPAPLPVRDARSESASGDADDLNEASVHYAQGWDAGHMAGIAVGQREAEQARIIGIIKDALECDDTDNPCEPNADPCCGPCNWRPVILTSIENGTNHD